MKQGKTYSFLIPFQAKNRFHNNSCGYTRAFSPGEVWRPSWLHQSQYRNLKGYYIGQIDFRLSNVKMSGENEYSIYFGQKHSEMGENKQISFG